jgi:hypothetical protein
MAARSNPGKRINEIRASEEIGYRNPASSPHDLMWPKHRMKTIKAVMLRLRRKIQVSIPEHEEQFKVTITQLRVPPT